MIVSAPSPTTGTDSGSAYVVYGQSAADPTDFALSALAARGFRIDGQAASDFMARLESRRRRRHQQRRIDDVLSAPSRPTTAARLGLGLRRLWTKHG